MHALRAYFSLSKTSVNLKPRLLLLSSKTGGTCKKFASSCNFCYRLFLACSKKLLWNVVNLDANSNDTNARYVFSQSICDIDQNNNNNNNNNNKLYLHDYKYIQYCKSLKLN